MSRGCQELSRECKARSKHMSRRCQESGKWMSKYVKRVPRRCQEGVKDSELVRAWASCQEVQCAKRMSIICQELWRGCQGDVKKVSRVVKSLPKLCHKRALCRGAAGASQIQDDLSSWIWYCILFWFWHTEWQLERNQLIWNCFRYLTAVISATWKTHVTRMIFQEGTNTAKTVTVSRAWQEGVKDSEFVRAWASCQEVQCAERMSRIVRVSRVVNQGDVKRVSRVVKRVSRVVTRGCQELSRGCHGQELSRGCHASESHCVKKLSRVVKSLPRLCGTLNGNLKGINWFIIAFGFGCRSLISAKTHMTRTHDMINAQFFGPLAGN